MSGLAFAQAPSPALPMRFLQCALAWGLAAGLWLAWQGEAVLLSRWTPATLVVVHMLALGLLGNAMLGVPEEVLKRCGAVSEPVVKAMAEGALERSGADVAVAVSGIAGPGGGTPEKPVGTVWLAWAFRGGKTRTEMMLYPRDRASFRKMVSQRALAGLLDARRKEPVTE